jgi:prenyltransferase beta subunit
MTISLSGSLIETASRAALILDDDARRDVAAFVHSCVTPDGGFAGRGGRTDLYYTLFGAECLAALAAPLPRNLAEYIESIDAPNLDLVHFACFKRLFALVGMNDVNEALTVRRFRAADGGFALAPGSARGTIYGDYMAVFADDALAENAAAALVRHIRSLVTTDGGFANETGLDEGTTTATAAAVVLLHLFGERVSGETVAWLRSMRHPSGGFAANPAAPVADLLSTATALYALCVIGEAPSGGVEATVGFVESLWHESGGFCGHAIDDTPDCEYTFYALLALGSLASVGKGASE